MKTKYIYTTLLSALFFLSSWNADAQVLDRSVVPKAGEAPVINIPKSKLFKLDNGLQVILVEDHSVAKIGWQLYVDYNSILEKDKAGMLEMFGNVLSAGTENRSKAEIDEEIDFIGARTFFSSNGFYASALTKHQDKLLEVLKDVVYNPTFPAEELEKVKTQTISGIKNDKSSAASMAANVRSVVNFGKNHPYGEIKTEETVASITSADLKGFYDTYFKPNISYLVIVGDINLEEAKAKAESVFGAWKKGDVPTHVYDTPKSASENQVIFVEKAGAVQSEIRVTFPVDLTPGSKDAIAVKVMNSILGGGIFSGRLMQNLREDHAYTYGCRSILSPDELAGEFYTFGSFRNEVSDSAITEILFEINRISDEPVKDDELSLTLNSMNGAFARNLESSQTVASFALNTIKYNLPEDYYQNYLTNLSKVTKEDVMRVAKEYLKPNNANIVVAGSPEIIESLKKFSKSGTVDERDMYGNKATQLKPVPEGVSAQSIIDDYLKAYTMEENMKKVNKKISKIKSIEQEMSAKVQGMALSFKSYKVAPNKESQIISMNGMTVQKAYFDGENGGATGMQGASELEAADIEEKKISARIDLEANYGKYGYTLEVLGIKEVNGEDAYRVKLIGPDDKETYNDYSVASKLLLRSESTTPEGSSVVIYNEYKEFDGFMFPSKMEITMGPQAIDAEVKSVKVNGKIDEAVFKK